MRMREAEANPEAQSSPVAVEAEPGTERKPEQPVGGEVAEHGSACVSCAAKCSRGDGLDAVEELESGTSGEESDGVADDGFVGGEEAGNVAGKDEQGDAHAEHETGAKNDGGVACEAGGSGFTAADGLANANGGGGGDAERNHVSEGDGVEGDLVRGQGNGTEASNERSDEGEDGDFGGELKGGGKTESYELADALEIGQDGSFEEFGFVARVVPQKIANEDEQRDKCERWRWPSRNQ